MTTSQHQRTTTEIADGLKATYSTDPDKSFSIRTHNPYDGTTHDVSVYTKEDAIALAKELLAWAHS